MRGFSSELVGVEARLVGESVRASRRVRLPPYRATLSPRTGRVKCRAGEGREPRDGFPTDAERPRAPVGIRKRGKNER